jgi:ABC-type transport system substrate-binding protein
MAGPYRVVSAENGEVVLERNPNYTGARPRRIERIVYTDGIKPDDAVSHVAQGRADYVSGNTITSGTPDALAPGGTLDTAFGLSSRAGRSGAARYVPDPAPGFDGIAFNTQRPLFRNARMRRAVSYALDRRALAAVYSEQPTDRLVPAVVGGPAGNIAYPNEPDLATARRLAGSGARRSATLYGCGPPTGRRIARIIRANLAKIGIDVHFDESLTCLTGPKPAQLAAADIQLVTGTSDLLDPAPFVELPLGNAYTAPGYWRDPPLRAKIEHARALRGAARRTAYARLEQTLVRDAAPVAVYAGFVTPEFFSERVGCTFSQGALGFADLGALCLRE